MFLGQEISRKIGPELTVVVIIKNQVIEWKIVVWRMLGCDEGVRNREQMMKER